MIMATLQQMPLEIMERILCSPELKAADIFNCCAAGPCFRNLCNGDNIWRMKLKVHYPSIYAKVLLERKDITPRELYTKLCYLYNTMCSNVMALSNVFVWSLYHDYEWPDIPNRALDLYLEMFDEELWPGYGRYYVLDECYNIIHCGDKLKNLTLKYYARKVYCFVNTDINFDNIWRSVALFHEDSTDKANMELQTAQFDYYDATYKLAVSIPLYQRVDSESLKENLNELYASVDERIKQHFPSILKCNLRVSHSESSNDKKTWLYSSSECKFLLKEIHDIVRHEFNFKSVNSSIYSGYRYCLDKVLMTRVGDSRILIALEALLAQHYAVCIEVHEDGNDCWRIFYHANDGMKGYYDCPKCNEERRTDQKVTLITETLFHRCILESLVKKFEVNLKNEWKLAGGPIVYNLLSEDTFIHSMRNIFSAWRHVEHWKIALLRHYSLLLYRVSDDVKLPGKILHLNILLRVRSNQTLNTLTDFRRRLPHPPTGIRELQRMVASVNIRARARFQELKAMLENGHSRKGYFLATFHPSQVRPWPHGWPGSDMIQKRRQDRKSWHVQFAVGQIVEIVRLKRPHYHTNSCFSCSNSSCASGSRHSCVGGGSTSSGVSCSLASFGTDTGGGITFYAWDGSSIMNTPEGESRLSNASCGQSSSSCSTSNSPQASKDEPFKSVSRSSSILSGRDDSSSRSLLHISSNTDDSDTNENDDDDLAEPPRKMDRIAYHDHRHYTARLQRYSSSATSPEGQQPTLPPRFESCYGVIFDWDSMCVESEDTLLIMGETDLICGTDQPFYRVLLDGGSSSYIAQEHLRHARTSRPINNPLLGRYFRAYVHPYYIPNMQKAHEYPEDATIREQDAFVLAHL